MPPKLQVKTNFRKIQILEDFLIDWESFHCVNIKLLNDSLLDCDKKKFLCFSEESLK